MFWLKSKKRIFFSALLLTVTAGLFLSFGYVFAQTTTPINFGMAPVEQNLGLAGADIRVIIARIIRAVLGLLGILALCIMLWGGYEVMTSGGNEEKISHGKMILRNGVIGLIIILSAFAIVQFVINQLAGATGANVEGTKIDCKDPAYMDLHKNECFPGWCSEDPKGCCLEEMKLAGLFVAQSITPKTSDTKMNNVAARAIFNMPISNQFSASGVISVLKITDKIQNKTEDITNKFDFKFIDDKDGKHIGIEASYKPDSGLCIDGKTGCINNGDYRVDVNENLVSESGKKISTGTEQCPFPMEADFAIKNNKRWVLNFDGVDDVVKASNPLKDGSNTIESWFYPTNKTGGMILSASPRLYYLRMTEAGALHFRSSGIPQQNPDKTYNWCDVYSANNVVELNKWHHVVATFDSITKNGYIYLDGKKVGEIPDSKKFAGCEKTSGGNLGVGGRYSGSLKKWTYNFNGQVASVCVYNDVLSEESAKAHFAAGVGSCGKAGENNLKGGWVFGDLGYNSVLDYSGQKNDGQISGGAQMELVSLPNSFQVQDVSPPKVNDLQIKGETSPEKVISGTLNPITSFIVDNGGVGYGRLTIERSVGADNKKTVEVEYFDGPSVAIGSDATSEKPYQYKYSWVPAKVEQGAVNYKLILTVWDIDHNQTTVSTTVTVVSALCGNGQLDPGEVEVDKGGVCGGDGLPGSYCTSDSQCQCEKCIDNKCSAQPKIYDVSPMDGAVGNWITITGKCFMNSGKVEFGFDSDKNGLITEKDTWVQTEQVDCGKDKTWNDSWVIIKVPGEPLPLNSSSSIRLTNESSLEDLTTDDYGPKPNKTGLFVKNEQKRPGLCSVKAKITQKNQVLEINQGPSGADAIARGSGFGKDGKMFFGGTPDSKTYLLTGGTQAKTSNWQDITFNTIVPDNIKPGLLSAYMTSGGQPSNGVPFTILSQEDVEKNTPVIDQIDPASSTKKSYITIFGHGFGNIKGNIYLAGSQKDALDCVSSTINECIKLNVNLPENCGNDTWSDKQVVAEVPDGANVKIGQYYLILKNNFGLYTSGADKFGIKDGPPAPSICKLEPDHGPAPLPEGKSMHLYGINFEPKISKDAITYFWYKNANQENLSSWLFWTVLKNPDKMEILSNGEHVSTTIPVTLDGETMQTGPIKIFVNNQASNGVKYTVDDCRSADAETKGQMTKKLFHCCENDGPDAGIWKPNSIVCAGEVRDAGYVWRFTTGKIRQLPKVLEQCNEADWNNPNVQDIDFPSPVPSILWKKGKEACISAVVAARFNVSMDQASLNTSTIKIYKCEDNNTGLWPNCDNKQEIKDWEQTVSANVVQMKPKDGKKMEKNTWYHVELSDKIVSSVCDSQNPKDPKSLATCIKDPLQKTKPCGTGTAYCFDFKTGTEMCTLKDASILPLQHTTNYLGLVVDPSYPLDSVPQHPYYYLLWGRGSQECVVLNVDGMGWKWASSNENQATVGLAPSGPAESWTYIDTRATSTAFSEALPPDGVKITAGLKEIDLFDKYDVLGEVNGGKELQVDWATTSSTVLKVGHIKGEDFPAHDNYEIRVKYNLTWEMQSLSGFNKIYEGDNIKYYNLVRYIYYKEGVASIGVEERVYPNMSIVRRFFFDVAPAMSAEPPDLDTPGADIFFDVSGGKINGAKPAGWSTGDYRIVRNENKLYLYVGNNDKWSKYVDFIDKPKLDLSKEVLLGGVMYESSKGYQDVLGGGILTLLFKINSKGGEAKINQSFTATSTLFIDLFPPTVVAYWPNCAEACVNTGIGVRFNRPMYSEGYKDKIGIWPCLDETCNVKLDQLSDWEADAVLSNRSELRISPSDPFAMLNSSTWYYVKVVGGENGVRALGKILPEGAKATSGDIGKQMEKDFEWKFRTRADDSPCKADKVSIIPNPFTALMIGQKTKYTALPKALVGECGGPQGTELNPWLYGWKWETGNSKVATVTDFHSSTSSNLFCGSACTLLGSDVPNNVPKPYLCGNGTIDPGEDCEITVATEKPGISCGYNCLRPGNSNFSTSTADGFCGNGKVESSYGEECDPYAQAKESKFCSNKCLLVGSSPLLPATKDVETPWCGSGSVTAGEECDSKIFSTSTEKSAVGCSEKCLHLGTQLSQSWCDKNGKDIPECKNAVSVCGNNVVESGEECDSNSKISYCNEYCLVYDLCNIDTPAVSKYKCKSSEDGCKADCTWAGSSVLYSKPSVCRDGKSGIGEYAECEVASTTLSKGEIPVQSVISVGEGIVDSFTKSQTTTIESTVTSFYDPKIKDFKALDEKAYTKGTGDYTLKCGNKENSSTSSPYNDCILPDGVGLTERGVANNTCCFNRAFRGAEYPVNGSGIATSTDDVCRNTYIAVEFANRFIDANSLPGNLIIAHGHLEPDYQCWKTGETNVTDEVKPLLADAVDGIQPKGFWQNIWLKVKSWFAGLFGGTVFAEENNQFGAEKMKVWCSGSIGATPALSYKWSPDLKNVTTTLSLYINKLLPPTTTMAVILRGGYDGIKDTQGVGIRNPSLDVASLVDAWFFHTGEKVCKLKDAKVDPESWLFSAPNTSSTFRAIGASENGAEIVPIQGQYYWKWDWQPSDSNIFSIPLQIISTSSDIISIGSKNVEGNQIAVANAKILEDVDTENNQLGKTFTGMTDLTAMFCENSWPEAKYFPFADGISLARESAEWVNSLSGFTDGKFDGSVLPDVNGEYFNYKMSYCADSGKSGDKTDDLPYLKPILFSTQEGILGEPKVCTLEDIECSSDSTKCNATLYSLPNVGITSIPAGSGVCWKTGAGPASIAGLVTSCGSAADCYKNSDWKVISEIKLNSENQSPLWATVDNDKIYAIIFKGIFTQSLVIYDNSLNTVGLMDFNGFIYDAFLSGNKLFVVGAEAGKNYLKAIDVSNPASLTVLNSYDFAVDSPFKIVVRDNKAYVVVKSMGVDKYKLYILDTTNMSVLSQTEAEGTPINLRLFDNYAYVLNGGSVPGIDVFKVADPKNVPNPSKLTINTMGGSLVNATDKPPTGMDITSGNIFVTVKFMSGGGRVIKFKKPNLDSSSTISLVNQMAFVGILNTVSGVIANEGAVFVTMPKVGLKQLDMSLTEAGKVINSYSPQPPVSINRVEIVGSKAVLSDNSQNSKITVLDIGATKGGGLYCNQEIGEYQNSCKQLESAENFITGSLAVGTLRRFMFVNDKNEDAIGIQLFENPKRLSADAWVKEKFPGISKFNPASVAGYDAVSDGTSYYINFLNEKHEIDLYNFIMLLTINKGAQADTQNVFDQLLKNLEFNINISNFGKCSNIVESITKLPMGELQAKNSTITCIDDFDCRNGVGAPLEGTNGICSNAKTKLKRDIERIVNYSSIQSKLSDYKSKSGNSAPDLKSGTYLSGYTVSKWPSWGKLGTIVGNLPVDKINKWAGCDAKADQTTCWDTASSTYYCPHYMQALEYEYVSSTKDYFLHGPFEYLGPEIPYVDFYLDVDHFDEMPWCTPDAVWSQAVGMCGNGVVNVGEACDPPGKTVISDMGVISYADGKCQTENYPNVTWGFGKCAVDIDCGGYVENQDVIVHSSQSSACTFAGKLIIGETKTLVGQKEKHEALGCIESNECKLLQNYNEIGPLVEIDGNSMAVSALENYPVTGFKCLSLSGLGYPNSSTLKCVGAGEPVTGDCQSNYQAFNTCSKTCDKWDAGMCSPIYKCGNAIVEPGEDCDDGGLNGTYGHCSKECKATGVAKCGDGIVNTSTLGKPLELCDKASFDLTKGYCKLNPAERCDNLNDLFCSKGATGPCVSTNDFSYDFYKIDPKDNVPRSCSWDCKNYGGYCGDGKVYNKNGEEECDDGDSDKLNSCDNLCTEVNLACRDTAKFATSTTSTLITIYENKKAVPECVDINKNNNNLDNTGNEICKAYGLTCADVEKKQLVISQWIHGVDCDDDLSSFNNPDIMTVVAGWRVVCSGVYTGPAPTQPVAEESKDQPNKYCGNGKVDEVYKDAFGKDVKEVCDMGLKNGDICIPSYGKSCTYCSSDCKEVLKVDSKLYCGDGQIAVNSGEVCENTDKGVWAEVAKNTPGFKVCSDKGKWLCEENCTKLIDKCVTCGNVVDTQGAKPTALVANVTNPPTWPKTPKQIAWWNTVIQLYSYAFLSYKDDATNNVAIGATTTNTLSFPYNINSNPICNPPGDSYKLQLNYLQGNSVDNINRKFDYSVHAESVKKDQPIVNEFIISPPLYSANQFRVVVRWDKSDKDIKFVGAVHNSGFKQLDGVSPVLYPSVVSDQKLCNTFWLETGCKNKSYNGVFVHPSGNLDNTYLQATTIDTNKWPYQTNYAFTVYQYSKTDPATGQPIGMMNFEKSNLIVELYTSKNPPYDPYKEDNDLVYKPDQVFKISDVTNIKTADSLARYWQVFNLVYNTSTKKYDIETVNKIRVGDKEVSDNVPKNEGNFSVGYTEFKPSDSDLDVNNFFWDGSKITNFKFGDMVVVGRSNPSSIFPNGELIDVVDGTDKDKDGMVNCTLQENVAGDYIKQCSDKFKLTENQNKKALISDYNYKLGNNGEGIMPYQDVQFRHLKDDLWYKYVYEFQDQITDQEFWEQPGFSLQYFIGGGSVENKLFIKDIGLKFDKSDVDNKRVLKGDQQWYLFNIMKHDNQIFIKKIDKFKSLGGIYSSYEYGGQY